MWTFDLRLTRKADLVRELDSLVRQHGELEFVRNGHILEAHSTNTPQGMAQLQFALDRTVAKINWREQMGITSASLLGNQFRQGLAGIRAKLDKASADMNSAMTELNDTADAATATVKQVQAETADLKAALGQVTNGPPTK